MEIDMGILTAIMSFMGIGILALVQTIKTFLHAKDIVALIIAAVVSFGATAIVLTQMAVFTWVAFIVYGLIVFGEASGFYKLYSKLVNAMKSDTIK